MNLVGSPISMSEVLARQASHQPDVEAIVAPDARLNYRELNAAVDEFASWVRSLGIMPGERIGLLMANSARWIVACLGANRAGITVVPMNTWHRAREIAQVVEGGGVRLVVADRKVFNHDVQSDITAAGLSEIDGENHLGSGCFVAYDDIVKRSVARVQGAAPVAVDTKKESYALILFTSGSTSEPKAVPLVNEDLVRNGYEIGLRQHFSVKDRIWFSGPFFFGLGCANVLPAALTHGATLCIQERALGNDSLRFIARERCTVYYGLAATTRNLLEASEFGIHDISSLKRGATGFTADEKRLAIEGLGVSQVCSVYGMSEGYGFSSSTAAGDPLDVVLSTQGRALPTQEIRVVRTDPEDVVGEIQLRGTVTPGYIRGDRIDRSAFTEDGWFRTGDLGYLDDEGRLCFTGRQKEMMKIRGINIAPAEVEAVLLTHPSIEQAYVFADPSDVSGAIACVLVAAHGTDLGELRSGIGRFVRERAASYKVPNKVQFRTNADLPLTDTGKVSKRLLEEAFEGEQA